MRDLLVIGVEDRQRGNIVALALTSRADRLTLLQRCEAKEQICRWRRVMWIVEKTERDAPVSDGAPWIRLEHLLEQLF